MLLYIICGGRQCGLSHSWIGVDFSIICFFAFKINSNPIFKDGGMEDIFSSHQPFF